MNRLVTALLAVTVLVSGGCGEDDDGVGTLIIEESQPLSGPLYVEGAVSFFALRWEGTNTLDGRLEKRVRRMLPEGTYELRAWQRPCGGNCELLDPPTDHCSARVDVDDAATTRVIVAFRPTNPCTISER